MHIFTQLFLLLYSLEAFGIDISLIALFNPPSLPTSPPSVIHSAMQNRETRPQMEIIAPRETLWTHRDVKLVCRMLSVNGSQKGGSTGRRISRDPLYREPYRAIIVPTIREPADSEQYHCITPQVTDKKKNVFTESSIINSFQPRNTT